MDIQTMGNAVFTTAAPSDGGPAAGKTLKDVFEAPDVPKVVFGGNVVRLLKGMFGVEMKGVVDLQAMAMENMAPASGESALHKTLETCIMELENITVPELENWRDATKKGNAEMAELARKRPLENEIMSYCLGEVQYLPELWESYNGRLG